MKEAKETFLSDCYVDCRGEDLVRIFQMIKNMSQEEIVTFRKAAIEFLASSAADRFTRRHLRQEILKKLENGIKGIAHEEEKAI